MDYPFKWRHYQPELILLCVRWYLRYDLSYRDLAEMMAERALTLDHTCAGYLSRPCKILPLFSNGWLKYSPLPSQPTNRPTAEINAGSGTIPRRPKSILPRGAAPRSIRM